MIMFAALAIAGPALHFVERRRRREAVNFRPPPWARVVALNAPTPRIRVTPRPYAGKPPAPMPIRPPDQTERWRMRCSNSWTVCRQPTGTIQKRSASDLAGAHRCE